jgi:hypothetical protein
LSEEVGADESFAFNFTALNKTTTPATAPTVTVPNVCPGGVGIPPGCLGEAPPIGEGPGGETVINCTTHQGVIADEFGQNLKLIHLPTKSVAGALDNNGRPGSGTVAGPASVFTIAAAVIPKGSVDGIPTQLGIVGDPNSLSIDPAHNFAYMLADTLPFFHSWQGGTTTPLFLVRVDLSAPVSGASPVGGINGTTFWTPVSAAIPMP